MRSQLLNFDVDQPVQCPYCSEKTTVSFRHDHGRRLVSCDVCDKDFAISFAATLEISPIVKKIEGE